MIAWPPAVRTRGPANSPAVPAPSPPPRAPRDDLASSRQRAHREAVARHVPLPDDTAREFKRNLPRHRPHREKVVNWPDPVVRSRRGPYLRA
ncbi:hypothetical protein [Nonomuraea sp. KM90]|uniref:hypothetical protein n=1 Tax=Nonomuraea sp. KM90 TaxID=3457428 RepID=UPI003FCED583